MLEDISCMDKTCYTCLFEKEDLLGMHCIKCVDFNLWMPKNTRIIEYRVEGFTKEETMRKTCHSCRFAKETDLSITPCPKCDKDFNFWEPKNIEAKADSGKPKLSLVPRQIIYDIAKIREYGNAKYPEGGPDNWKKVEIERYRDAAFRHFLAYLDDPKGADKESGLPHLAHLACNIAFLCELEKGEKDG
jgi:hypothetical protein